MRPHTSVATLPLRSDARILETTILIGLSVGIPIVIHLIPSAAVPWGARLLPMFYAPVLGALLYRLHVGLIPALLAPSLNALITGSPALTLVPIMTVELVVFTVCTYALFTIWHRHWLVVLFSYASAKAGTAALIMLIPFFAGMRPAVSFVLGAFGNALPGLLALTVLTVLIGYARAENSTK